MRGLLSRMARRSLRRKSRRRKLLNRRFFWPAEQMEERVMLSAAGIVVNDVSDRALAGEDIVTFPYSGGPSGTFSVVESGALPIEAFESPGMPPMDGRNGVWEFVGLGDINGDGYEDMVAKDTGMATASPTAKDGQWWVALNDGFDMLPFELWDGAIPTTGTVGGGTNQITWGDHQVADFTGDGNADVLARVRETGEWYLWTTNSTGTGFTVETTGITPNSSLFGTWNNTVAVDSLTEHHFQWRDALVGDFDDDGIMDLAGRRITNDTGLLTVDEWYIGLGSATTTDRGETGAFGNTWWNMTSWQHDTTIVEYDTTWANAVVGDFDGDGQDDIAGRMAYPTESDGDRPGEWWVSYTPDTIGFRAAAVARADWDHAIAGDQLHWRDVQSGDFDNNGVDDILGRTKHGDWYLVDVVLGTTSQVGAWGTDYGVAVAGDFTGDGKIDLASRYAYDMQWHLSPFTSGGGIGTFPTPVARGGYRMLDTSTREDFFVQGTPQGDLGSSLPLALLQDLGRFNPPPRLDMDPQFIVGRYNANGSLDWEGYGAGLAFANDYGYSYDLDFNGDDIPDVMMQLNDGQWYFAENYGNSFVAAVSDISWPLSEQRWLLIGDFTGDGKEDLLSQKTTGSLSADWYLHASRGDGTFTTDLIHSRSYTTSGEHVWLVGGWVGDFDNDGRDDVEQLHKLNDDPFDRTWVGEVVFSNAVSPNPGNPTPFQPAWTAVLDNWEKVETSSVYGFTQWGVGDFNGDGTDDIWGIETHNVIVGPPQLTEDHYQVWVGYGSGRTSGKSADGVYMMPETTMDVDLDSRGSRAGRFDSSADLNDDIVLEVVYSDGFTPNELQVIESTGWTLDLVADAGRTGAEQFVYVGDMDNDGSDDLIWIGTTPEHPINLFVRVDIVTIPWWHTGEVIDGNGVPSYIWPLGHRLRRRKPN